jgi:transcriptional regulator with XRE-family HTH domain
MPSGVEAALSVRVQTLRRARGLSLDQLAARASVSKGILVRIEQGRGNPSIAILCSVAAGLGVSVADLVRPDDETTGDVVPVPRTPVLWRGPKGGTASLLAGSTGPDMLELWAWELRRGEEYVAVAHPAGTEELLYVTRGQLAVTVGKTRTVVNAGSGAVAYTDRPHAYACAGRRAVSFTMVVAEFHPARASHRDGAAAPRRVAR